MRSTALLATILVLLATIAGASAAPYAVMTGVKGVVDLYDLGSVERTSRGFRIWDVAVSDHWPSSFGPIAFRLAREDYDCGSGRYDIAVVRDYDHDGTLLNDIHTPDHGEMIRVPATAASEMFNRFCPADDRAPPLAGLSPRETVERGTTLEAARYAQGLLDGMR